MPVEATQLRCAYVLFAVCAVVAAASKYSMVKNDCELEQCMEDMKNVMHNQKMNYPTSEEDLNAVCLTFNDKIQCIDDYISKCFTAEKKEMSARMRQNSMGVIDDLCNDGKYRNEYLQHASCISNASNYQQCSDRLDQLMKESVYVAESEDLGVDQSLISYCCAISNYEDCMYDLVQQICSNETFVFYQQILNRSLSAFKARCINYTAHSAWCSAGSNPSVQNCTLLQLLLVIAVVIFLISSYCTCTVFPLK